MGIEWVNGAKGGGAGEGKCSELRRWSAIGRRKERWRGVAGEVMRRRPKGSGHTAAEADRMAGFVVVDASATEKRYSQNDPCQQTGFALPNACWE